MKRNERNTLGYKVRMWFYRLTLEDIIKFLYIVKNIVAEVIFAVILFGALLFLPHFFH